MTSETKQQDPANDGPEVKIILREKQIETEEKTKQ